MHVGGTNGKGSVAVLVADALRAAGFRTGLYTSPHLVDVRERMLVDGAPISRNAFAAWTERLRGPIEAHGASFFEATTAIAFADFAARGADVVVAEVGLGGRLDSTNVLHPLVSAVTHVSREHVDYLGDDLAGIAREKAGIAKPGTPFIIGESDPSLRAVLRASAVEAGAIPHAVPPDASWEGPLGLRGAHQRRNAAVAAAVLEALPPAWRPAPGAIGDAFARVSLPGRYQRYGRWVFDVAHNAGGMRVLCATLAEERPRRPVHAVAGILADKAWEEMLRTLAAGVDAVWVTDPPTAPADRRLSLATVAAALNGTVRVEPEFDVALAAAAADAGTIVVCGSFHTVGDAMARLPGSAPLG